MNITIEDLTRSLTKGWREIPAFICSENNDDEESIYQKGTLHIHIPSGVEEWKEASELEPPKFIFKDENESVELEFDYVESYNARDKDGNLCDGYYFLPLRRGDKFDNLHMKVSIAYGYVTEDDPTTIKSIVILTM